MHSCSTCILHSKYAVGHQKWLNPRDGHLTTVVKVVNRSGVTHRTVLGDGTQYHQGNITVLPLPVVHLHCPNSDAAILVVGKGTSYNIGFLLWNVDINLNLMTVVLVTGIK